MVLNQGLGEGLDGDAGFDASAVTDEAAESGLADERLAEIDRVRRKAGQYDVPCGNSEDAIGFHAHRNAGGLDDEFAFLPPERSEERRVGKERRSRWSP